MKKIVLFSAASLTISISFAQPAIISSPKNKEAPAALLYLSAGGALSAIDFSRYNGGPRYRGYNFRVWKNITPAKQISVEYTQFPKHRLAPDWDSVKTWNVDMNLHYNFTMKNNSSGFYVLMGLEYHNWKAKYNGTTIPEKQFKRFGAENFYRTIRWGANFGTGFNIHLNEMGLFTEMHFTLSPSNLNTKLRIIDVVYSAGITYGIPMPNKKISVKSKRKSLGISKGIYKWIKKRK